MVRRSPCEDRTLPRVLPDPAPEQLRRQEAVNTTLNQIAWNW